MSVILPNNKPEKVFFDANGTRWLWTKATAMTIIFLIVYSLLIFWPSLVNSKSPNAQQCCRNTATINFPADLAYSGNFKDPLIIGKGYLERVMKIENDQLVDPFNKRSRSMTESEKVETKGREYVIERYGAAKGKFVSLTFDDGPDPKYTPQILDVLARENVKATFFVTGENATKYPQIVKRMVEEGHMVAGHTFTHIDFDNVSSFRGRQEIIATDQVIRSITGYQSTYFRLPYNGGLDDTKSLKANLRGLMQAQQLGFEVASFNVDSNDWEYAQTNQIPAVSLKEDGNVILMHDSGGDRSKTIDHLNKLIRSAKDGEYSFLTMAQLRQNPSAAFSPTAKDGVDSFIFALARIIFVLPERLISFLFTFSAINIVIFTLLNIIFVLLNKHKTRKNHSRLGEYQPFVSVIVAAYNEELVIEKTVASIAGSEYEEMEIIVVNDGSTDNTKKILETIKNKFNNLSAIHQANCGKSRALNNAIQQAKGEIVVTADADTIFLPDTVKNLVRHFADARVGAVAGYIKVGNTGHLLTSWQALEYITSTSIEKFAYSLFKTVMIVPGACGAWRKKAVIESGWFSSKTLAEDCDLTIKIQKNNYLAVNDIEATAFTEAPKSIRDLLKQRFRWMFGIMQVLWKHKGMVLNPRHGILGMFIMPQAAFSLIVQIVFLPFVYIITIQNLLSHQYRMVLIYVLGLAVFQFFLSLFAIWVSKEKYTKLLIVPLYRFLAEPLRAFLLYSCLLSILKGRLIEWNKVSRLGNLELTPVKVASGENRGVATALVRRAKKVPVAVRSLF